MRSLASPLLLLLVWLAFAGAASASSVLYEGAGGTGTGTSAAAAFRVDGTDLIVTLTNTSTNDVLRPVDVLTAVFFDIEGDLSLSRESAALAPGGTGWHGSSSIAEDSPAGDATVDGDGVVRGQWAYKNNLSGAPGGAPQTISSSGLSAVGPHDRSLGADLQGPESPGGLQYGVTSAGDDSQTGNAPVTGQNSLIQNSVIFTLSGLPGGFNPAHISNVFFPYRTDLSEPSFAGTIIPEPGGLYLFGLGAIGLAGFGWRRRRRGAASVAVSETESTRTSPRAP